MQHPSLESLFFAGEYQKILDLTVHQPDTPRNMAEAHLVVGSLIFVGHLQEAGHYFKRDSATMNQEQQVACRVFLSIGYSRYSRYEDARRRLSRGRP